MATMYRAILSVLLVCVSYANADTVANCTYEDIKGSWMLSMGPGGNGNDVDCKSFTATHKIKVDLMYPDVAVDEFNNKGFWTMIYNQGFEVVVGGRKYFAFSKYEGTKSFCGETMVGTSHDLLGRDWACYTGSKMTQVPVKVSNEFEDMSLRFGHEINSEEMVRSINARQNSWKAVKYDDWTGMAHDDFVRMAGGKNSKMTPRPKPLPLTEEHERIIESLPEQFDWRDVKGTNLVSPVRDQGNCGSCYAFASMAMNEARVRIMTNNTQQPVFSPQDIVDCSPYSQGCEGGFPYLIGGKYAEDYGLVEEVYNPYHGMDGACVTKKTAPRHFSTKYRYIGGYYGACNEAVMMKALYESGPIAVGFEVYSDFMSYKSGVYHHVFNEPSPNKFNPFELTNHAVLVVGWGKDENSGQKYWIVKNSWSSSWGQEGYFWILRGSDECGIESMAVESFPMITFNN